MTRFTTILCALALATPALAETRLERMERLSIASQMKVFATMPGGIPADIDARKTLAWTPELREKAGCMLDEHDARIGTDGVDQMLDEMEAFLERDFTDFETASTEMGEIAPDIPEADSDAIQAKCGFTEAYVARLMSSDLMMALIRSGAMN